MLFVLLTMAMSNYRMDVSHEVHKSRQEVMKRYSLYAFSLRLTCAISSNWKVWTKVCISPVCRAQRCSNQLRYLPARVGILKSIKALAFLVHT